LKETYIATGIYLFKRDALEPVDERNFIDHTGEIFPIILKHGKKVSGFKTSAYWSDIGDFKNYLETNRWVLENNQGRFPAASSNIDPLSYAAPSSTITPTTKVEASLILDESVVKDNCEISNSMIYENVIVNEGCRILNSIIAEHTVIGDNVIVENSMIGAGVTVKDNSVIKNARIWPKIIIEENSRLEGTIQHYYLPLK
jgi:glucose-1-phosphate adenylyltransferase